MFGLYGIFLKKNLYVWNEKICKALFEALFQVDTEYIFQLKGVRDGQEFNVKITF